MLKTEKDWDELVKKNNDSRLEPFWDREKDPYMDGDVYRIRLSRSYTVPDVSRGLFSHAFAFYLHIWLFT